MLMLVPTRVGMILSSGINDFINASCPHTRGDDPLYCNIIDG